MLMSSIHATSDIHTHTYEKAGRKRVESSESFAPRERFHDRILYCILCKEDMENQLETLTLLMTTAAFPNFSNVIRS